MSVEKNVKIRVISKICPIDGDEETYELWLQGIWIKKNDNMYLRYEEIMEDKKIKTTVKMNSDNALILRSGDVNMRLPFSLESRQNGHYDTMYGTLPLQTKTYRIGLEHSEEDNISGRFNVQYDLIISGHSVGHYSLEIQYTEGQA
ncbi:DUF1934 domain-containing protein [Ureibacillus sp. FSL K6-8385]|uniref:DUF1934 domain-containing protein n=1 Tax=Ureibacillus terrenus TaxID=118246 RepID=A0A540V291_9BACL|nr:DUF1934 domain-containing protein [Ureibacillus terrenus]MED3661338.1 DUF1934 domain-containing protein [Ureibacillus terrenus]MED3764190.1 DUF1934 domain-containing protein [Ureibacillus terrenus]TQE90856.1 DUF1934 domain-containing protein [Ureibacillus terrenus]